MADMILSQSMVALCIKSEKHFIKMLKDVGMTMLKSTETRCSISRHNQ